MMRRSAMVALLVLACGAPPKQGGAGGGGGHSGGTGGGQAQGGGQSGTGGGDVGTGGGSVSTGGGQSDTGGGTSATGGGTSGTGGGTTSTLTTLRVHYPAGSHTIGLRGSLAPLNWNTNAAMNMTGNDTWVATVNSTAASFEFKPLLDSTWSLGPNYVAKAGATVDIYPRFNTVNGRYYKLINAFHSTNLPNDRGVWVYLPPSYDENTTARFPVLYMHDGQNLFDVSTAFSGEWKVDETLNAAAQDGSIREMIVIGVENTADRVWEYTGGPMPSAGGDAYRALLIDELKPQIDGMLRTLPGRETTGIMGSSMGGHISAYIAATRPDIFSMTGDVSTTVFGLLLSTVGQVKGQSVRAKVYIDCGTDNDSQAGTDALYAKYLDDGYVEGVDIKKVLQQGANHNEFWWAQRLPGALQFLFGPRQ